MSCAHARVFKMSGMLFVVELDLITTTHTLYRVWRWVDGNSRSTDVTLENLPKPTRETAEAGYSMGMAQALHKWQVRDEGVFRLDADDREAAQALARLGLSDLEPAEPPLIPSERQARALERIAAALEKLVGGEVNVDALFQQYDSYFRSKSL